MSRKGFTLIESLAVIAIIGILASIVTVSVFAAQRQARDAKRKSDLTAISFGFEARFNDKTCTLREYPHNNSNPPNLGLNTWSNVTALVTPSGGNTDCTNFSNYLKIIPQDRTATNPYKFNLASDMQHYRLTAILERDPGQDLTGEGSKWRTVFGGSSEYGAAINGAGTPYNYFIGR